MIGTFSQNFEAVAQLQAELHLLKIERLDACIRPLFANPITYIATNLYTYCIYSNRAYSARLCTPTL